MPAAPPPFSVPEALGSDLARLRDHWSALRRGNADMPFSDDFNPRDLPDLLDRVSLIDVFEKPMRFRFGLVGQQLTHQYASPIAGRFLDEIEPANPLEYLSSQCSATMEGRVPTFYRHLAGPAQRSRVPRSYARLVLPMWGAQQMLLVGWEWM